MSNAPEIKIAIPSHVAIIMDGNRRWAKAHGLEILQGHQKVARETIKRLVNQSIKHGVKFLTLWAFSTENWHRDQSEVQGLMSLFREAFGENAAELHKLGVKLNLIGDLESFPVDIQTGVRDWLAKTSQNQAITVTLALGYGGRDEILRAVKKLVANKIPAEEITEAKISQTLDTAGMPDPDLIIRPGGEKRLSGFLTWQSVYSELYFSPILMPDFDEAALDEALAEYAKRARRFGS